MQKTSQAEPENRPTKECQNFYELVVCVSELANWHGVNSLSFMQMSRIF